MRKLKIYISPYQNNTYLVAYDVALRRVVEMRTIPSACKMDEYIKSMMKKYAENYRIIYK